MHLKYIYDDFQTKNKKLIFWSKFFFIEISDIKIIIWTWDYFYSKDHDKIDPEPIGFDLKVRRIHFKLSGA